MEYQLKQKPISKVTSTVIVTEPYNKKVAKYSYKVDCDCNQTALFSTDIE